jgi:hypothetical protein
MSRSFQQFSDDDLAVLAKVTLELAAKSAAKSFNARRKSKRDRSADSDFDRYSRCARWIERERVRRAAL